jgi:uracil phosphoribosyltransferase
VPVHLVRHAVADDALVRLRDRSTTPGDFRAHARRVALVVAQAGTQTLPTTPTRVETPLEATEGARLSGGVVVVPVLRAGLGMVEAVLALVPDARVGHIGLERDERTAVARAYFSKLPRDLSGATALVVDPMLATGGSAITALNVLREAGATDIRLLCIVAAPEGIAAVEAAHPTAAIFTPAIDRELNASKFILPGLGDFGDRLYDTA